MRYPGLLGFREVAGLRTRSGGRVRPGLLYRSGTPQFLDLAAGRRLLADTGIASTIDLRLPHEVDQEGRGPLDRLGVRHAPHPVRLRALVAPGSAVAPMPGDDPLVGTYLRYLDEGAEAVAGSVAELLEPGTLPVLLHCTVGKDRTGAVVAVLLDALGVEHEDIAADYARGAADAAEAMARLRTMASYGDAVDVYPPEALTAEPGTILRFLAAVDDRHGGSRAFLLDHGLTPAMLDELDALLVEHPG
ncbi:tyrosine-protein phosphatase [Pseudonocardia halophobica]|uniref:tyrosine-protein phosphatase n=1 Tax=Pseudonocardia halophobica TaxID=29401 RepID=UPI00056CDA72|nr:tyrosine-protein phosphatase [Pseudonocardia halophobica]